MPWAEFDRLCRFWFARLFALEQRIGALPAGYQQRVIAFLSERVFDVHIRRLRAEGRRLVELPIFHREDRVFARAGGPA